MGINFKINGNKNIEHDKINAKLGITDKKNHSVFYFEGGAFIIPKTENFDFNNIMNTIKSNCKHSIKNKLMNHPEIDTNFIMNFNICSDRMKKNKNSYLSFQYHFKQKNNNNSSIMNIKDNNKAFFISLLNDIENELNYYDIKIFKKRKIETC